MSIIHLSGLKPSTCPTQCSGECAEFCHDVAGGHNIALPLISPTRLFLVPPGLLWENTHHPLSSSLLGRLFLQTSARLDPSCSRFPLKYSLAAWPPTNAMFTFTRRVIVYGLEWMQKKYAMLPEYFFFPYVPWIRGSPGLRTFPEKPAALGPIHPDF